MKSGWQMVRLSEIAVPVSRPVTVTTGVQYRTIGVKWWGEGAYERQTIDGSETAAQTLFSVRKDDLIINKIWVRHGSTAIASDAVDGCAASNEFPTFELDRTRVLPRWLHWLSKTKPFWKECDKLSRGTSGKNRIKPELFLTIEVPLPLLEEQQRIVQRIEELSAKIEEARGLRRRTMEQAERIHGAATNEILYAYSNVERVAIELLADVRGGIQKGPHRTPGENPVRYLTVAHVHRNRISTSDPRYFEVSSEELERWRLLPGDVLIIEGNGSAEQIGRTAIFRGEIEHCVHQNHVIRIRPNKELIEAEFLNLYLNSPVGQDEVQSRSRTTSGLRTLSVGRIKQIAVPFLPLTAQKAICASANELHKRTAALKLLQVETAEELNALLPSVLDKAFKGEL